MIVRELITLLGFEIEDGPLNEIQEKVEEFGKQVLEMSATMAGAGAVLFGFGKITAEAAEHAGLMAQRLGVNVVALQELQFAAKASGVESDSFAQSLAILNHNITQAALGSREAGAALGRAGLNLSQFGGKLPTTEQALLAISDRFKELPEGPMQSAFAMQVFGRAGAQMVPLLKRGSAGIKELRERAEELGGVMSADTVKDARAFNDALGELMFSFKGIIYTVGAVVVRGFKPMLEQFQKFVIINKKFITSGLDDFMKSVAASFRISLVVMQQLLTSVRGLLRPFGGMLNVLRALIIGFTIFKALKLVSSIGDMTLAIIRGAMAMKGLGISAMIAQAQVIALPLAIGAAVVALGLIIEDFFTFITGGDSVIGRLMEKFTLFKNVFGPILDPLKDLFSGLANGTLSWKDALLDVGKTIIAVILAPLRTVSTLIGSAFSFLGNKVGSDTLKSVGNFASGVGAADVFDLGKPGPALTPGAASASSGQSIEINSPVSVTVPPGTPAEKIPAAVQSGIADGLDGVLRGANRTYLGAPAY